VHSPAHKPLYKHTSVNAAYGSCVHSGTDCVRREQIKNFITLCFLIINNSNLATA